MLIIPKHLVQATVIFVVVAVGYKAVESVEGKRRNITKYVIVPPRNNRL